MSKWKKVLVIITVIIIIFLAVALLALYKKGKRKADILSTMNEKMYELNEGKVDNAYVKIEDNYGYTEMYKNNVTTKYIKYSNSNQTKNISIYSNMEKVEYLENGDGTIKTMGITNEDKFEEKLFDNIEIIESDKDNIIEMILFCLNIKFGNINIDGKECYMLGQIDSDTTFYIDKETLLPVRIVYISIDEDGESVENTINYDIRYNVVTERDVQKLDESEYTLVD